MCFFVFFFGLGGKKGRERAGLRVKGFELGCGCGG